jgi:hypothetical protein
MRKRVIGAAIVGLLVSASSTSIAQIAKEGTKAPELSKERKLSLCVESWDAATHMSKREWRRVSAASKTIQMPSSAEAPWSRVGQIGRSCLQRSQPRGMALGC